MAISRFNTQPMHIGVSSIDIVTLHEGDFYFQRAIDVLVNADAGVE